MFTDSTGDLKKKLAVGAVILLLLTGIIFQAGKKVGLWGLFGGGEGVALEANNDSASNTSNPESAGSDEGKGSIFKSFWDAGGDQRSQENAPDGNSDGTAGKGDAGKGTTAPGASGQGTAEQGMAAGASADGSAGQGTAGSRSIAVHVIGAVQKPGVYYLPAGARVHQALALSGTRSDAALDYVNLAQPLQDGEQVVIPTKREAARLSRPAPAPSTRTTGSAAASSQRRSNEAQSSQASKGSTNVPSGPINLNTATLEQLDTLPGIGPAYAQRIIDYRDANGPFQSVQDLEKVSGIGPKKSAALAGLVTVR